MSQMMGGRGGRIEEEEHGRRVAVCGKGMPRSAPCREPSLPSQSTTLGKCRSPATQIVVNKRVKRNDRLFRHLVRIPEDR